VQPTQQQRRGISPQTSAWLILLIAFTIFCLVIASAALLGWRYYTSAMVPVGRAMLRSHVETGVFTQGRGQVSPSGVERLPTDRDPCPDSGDICAYVSEGESVKTRREAGYGSVASLVLPDQSHIQFWASPTGADLVFERFQRTQWNRTRQEVLLTQRAGYVRYDIRNDQPYDYVDYTIQVGSNTSIRLQPGGSYSVYVPNGDPDRILNQTLDGQPLRVEVAVRTGSVLVVHNGSEATIAPGQKIQITNGSALGEPMAAEWQLIADGNFNQYRQQNNYGEGSKTWQEYWNINAPGLTEREQNGRLAVVRGCRPEMPDLCSPEDQVSIGQLRRDGGQTKPFTVGMLQKLDVDISEFRSLKLRGWVRVLQQSLPGAGSQGSECPLMVRLQYKPTSPTDAEQPREICIFSTDGGPVVIPDLQVISYRPIPPYTWYLLDIELRDDPLIRYARYLQVIRIESRGHDYFAEVTGFSLIGQQ
jgi:hypothetical protein